LLLRHVVLLCFLLYLLHVVGCSPWGHPLLHLLKLLLMHLCRHAAADLDWNLITLKLMRHDIDSQLHWQLLLLPFSTNIRQPILLQHANSRPSALQASFNICTLQESFLNYWVIQFHLTLIRLTPLLTQAGIDSQTRMD
jgi:hypothetical protein